MAGSVFIEDKKSKKKKKKIVPGTADFSFLRLPFYLHNTGGFLLLQSIF